MNEYVVLVDDEVSNTSSISENIELEDRKVISFNDPKEFLDFLSSNKLLHNLKLLVVDFAMPKINGFDVFKFIFDNQINLNTKFILYSGNINQLKDSDKNFLLSMNVELLEKPATEQIINYAIEFVKES